MIDKQPLTIEILGLDHDHSIVVDRVIAGSVGLEEAKRIGRYLLALADAEQHPCGYRVLSNDRKLVYHWSFDESASSGSN